MLVGAGLTIAVFLTYASIKRRRKTARQERPPQSAKLLRPAGYWLSCQIEGLSEKFNLAVMESVAAGMSLGLLLVGIYPLLAGLVLQRFTFAQIKAAPNSYYLYSFLFCAIASMAWLTAAVAKTIKCLTEIRNYRFGLRGEQAVAEALANPGLISAGYVVFHDVPTDQTGNIDHVLVGPSGIYVLETKTRPKRKPTRDQREQFVIFDGKTLQFPWCYDAKAVRQVERNAMWVRDFISGFGPKEITVQPVIVVPGWYVESKGNYPVKAMPQTYLVNDFLLPVKRQFSEDKLLPIIRRLDERCRTLEF